MNDVEDALRAWVKASTGFDNEHVFFSDQKVPRPSGPYVTIRLGSVGMLGAVDPIEVKDAASPTAGAEIELQVRALREVSVGIQVWNAPAVAVSPALTAVGIASKIQVGLSLPSVRDAFAVACVSVIDMGSIQNLSSLLGTDFDGRSSFDVRCYVMLSASEFTTYIEKFELTNTSTGEMRVINSPG